MTTITPAQAGTTTQGQRPLYTTPTVTKLCLIETAGSSKNGVGGDFQTLAGTSVT